MSEFPHQQESTKKRTTIERKKEPATMTDAERLRAFAETGNAQYLTPGELEAHQIRLDDQGQPYSAAGNNEEESRLLARYGIDVQELVRSRDTNKIVKTLLPLAIKTVPNHIDILAEAKNVAQLELSRHISAQPEEMLKVLFETLDPNSLTTLETIRFLEDEAKLTREYFVMLTENHVSREELRFQTAERILMAYLHEAPRCQKRLWDDRVGSYFVFEAMSDFTARIRLGGEQVDPDIVVPFEISQGSFAVFSRDKNRIYLASSEDSLSVSELLQYSWTPDYKKLGHDAPTYNLDYFDENLLGLYDSIIESGKQLTDAFPREFKSDPALLRDYVTLMHSRFRAIIEEDLGFRLRDLTIREQLYFLKYAKETPRFGMDPLRNFIDTHGVAGLRTFLVTADDAALRGKVFEFAGSVRKENAQQIFGAYGDIVGTIDNMDLLLRDMFGERGQKSAETLIQKMLDRAKNLLIKAYEYREKPEELLNLAQSISADNAMFYEGFKELRKSGEISDFSEIGGLEFRSFDQSSESFSQADRDEMVRITNANYADKSQEFREAVVEGLTNSFDKPGTRFYVLRFKNKIVGFNRFDNMDPTAEGRPRKYFGSFNVDPAYGNGKLGDVMIEQTVGHESKEAIVEAHCLPAAPITQRYLKDGFKVVGEDATMYPEPVWHIILDRLSTDRSK
jgi:hypothetical protein